MKRKILILLSALIIMFALPVIANAQIIDSGECGANGNNVTWELDDKGTLTISGTGEMDDYEIGHYSPWLNNKKISKLVVNSGVTSIGMEAFRDCSNLNTITIANTVIDIGYKAFEGTEWYNNICENTPDGNIYLNNILYEYIGTHPNGTFTVKKGTVAIADYLFCNPYSAGSGESNLYEVELPDSIVNIGEGAFSYCSNLKKINLPEGLIKISGRLFSHCNHLTDINIPDSVTSIGEMAFYGCDGLKSVYIPKNVKSIGNQTFGICGSLNINVAEDNHNYSDINGVLFNKDKTEIIAYAKDNMQPEFTIPSNVTSIGAYAFCNCRGLTNIYIPNSVESIGSYAFSSCENLTNVTIPDGAISIGEGAFYYCTSLTNIYIPNSIKSIGEMAFYFCESLTNITIPDGVTNIGDYAFDFCKSLTSITIPDSVTGIGELAFYGCDSLSDVYYGGSETDWKNIEIGERNECLLNATIHYNYVEYDPITPAALTVTPSGNAYTLTAETDYDGDAYAAAYDAEGALISVVSKPFADGTATVTPNIAGAAKIKFFVWTNTVQPVALAEEITLN